MFLPHSLFFLIDCNSFYASCERIFRPDLVNKPVIVLSNNDGCIVSLSKEAKNLGLKRGEPFFKRKPFLEKNNVAVFSSNYELYADISDRVMCTVESVFSPVEVYSIDECFVCIPKTQHDNIWNIAKEIRERVRQWVGIPVSIGIGETKTLAKLANHIAKSGNGIFRLNGTEEQQDALLKQIPVEKVWGIGRAAAKLLYTYNKATVYDLKTAHESWIKSKLKINGWRTLMELHGVQCIDNDTQPLPRKTLIISRSFGERITDKEELRNAVSTYAARAGAKLRKDKMLAYGLSVHIRNSLFDSAVTSDTATISFPSPTNDSMVFVKAALKGLETIYKERIPYSKAGIMLFDLVQEGCIQGNLLDIEHQAADIKQSSLMETLDKINEKWGKYSLHFGSEDNGTMKWAMRREQCSPRYTTSLSEIAKAKC